MRIGQYAVVLGLGLICDAQAQSSAQLEVQIRYVNTSQQNVPLRMELRFRPKAGLPASSISVVLRERKPTNGGSIAKYTFECSWLQGQSMTGCPTGHPDQMDDFRLFLPSEAGPNPHSIDGIRVVLYAQRADEPMQHHAFVNSFSGVTPDFYPIPEEARQLGMETVKSRDIRTNVAIRAELFPQLMPHLPTVLTPGAFVPLEQHIRKIRELTFEALIHHATGVAVSFNALPRNVREAAYDHGQIGDAKYGVGGCAPAQCYFMLHYATGFLADFPSVAAFGDQRCSSHVWPYPDGTASIWPDDGRILARVNFTFSEGNQIQRTGLDPGLPFEVVCRRRPPFWYEWRWIGSGEAYQHRESWIRTRANWRWIGTGEAYQPRAGDMFWRHEECDPRAAGIPHAMILLAPPYFQDGEFLLPVFEDGHKLVLANIREEPFVNRAVGSGNFTTPYQCAEFDWTGQTYCLTNLGSTPDNSPRCPLMPVLEESLAEPKAGYAGPGRYFRTHYFVGQAHKFFREPQPCCKNPRPCCADESCCKVRNGDGRGATASPAQTCCECCVHNPPVPCRSSRCCSENGR